MSKFVTKRILAVSGRQVFRELVIIEDNKINTTTLQQTIDRKQNNGEEIDDCPNGVFENFENTLQVSYRSSLLRIIGNMNRVANLQLLPKEKFKDVTPTKETVKEYEYKYGDLRVLCIKIPNGQLVIIGGYKNKQEEYFKSFRELKKQYLEFLKSE